MGRLDIGGVLSKSFAKGDFDATASRKRAIYIR
jgi:hypothetical protein